MRKLLITLALCLFCTNIQAAEDPRFRVYPQQEALRFKGLDERSSPTFLQDGYAQTAQNVQFSSTNALMKRWGYSLVKDFDVAGYDWEPVEGIYYTKLSSGTAYRLTILGSRMYSETGGTYTWEDQGGGWITSGQNNQFVWETALDTVVFTNNVDVIYKWTGTSTFGGLDVSDLTDTLTAAQCVAWFKNYLILGNTTEAAVTKATRIRWSDVGTIETWGDDNYIDIGELGGQEIVGFGILYNNLYVFLTDSIHKVTLVGGDEIFNIAKVVEGTGCIAKNSIQNVSFGANDGLMFLSKDKSINFFNGMTTVDASYYIPDTMDDLNTSRLQYAVSCTDGSDYYLSVSDGTATTNDLIIDINLDTGDISTLTNILANAMADVLDTSEDVQLYFGNYDSHIYNLYDSSLDSDVAGYTGTFEDSFDAGEFVSSDTATYINVVFDDDKSFACTGALVTLVAGTGSGASKVITGIHTSSGIIVDSAWATAPDDTTQYSIGAIDADYVTKWYSMGEPARRKHFGEMYFWAESADDSSIDINYSRDFGSYAGTQSVSLSGSGGLWGSAVWGTDTWGGEDALYKEVKLKGDARYIKFRIEEDDIDETFNIYGWAVSYLIGDVQ